MKEMKEMSLEEIKKKRCPPDCPDRSIEPVNCHMICKEYIDRQRENEEKKQKKKFDTEFNSYKKSRVDETKKKLGLFK